MWDIRKCIKRATNEQNYRNWGLACRTEMMGRRRSGTLIKRSRIPINKWGIRMMYAWKSSILKILIQL